MSKKWIIIIVILLLITAGAAYYYFKVYKPKQTTSTNPLAPKVDATKTTTATA
jgi:uncharacterized protein YpmB